MVGLFIFFDQMGPAQFLAELGLRARRRSRGDIARAAVFLASEDSSYVNGSELFVDGGGAQYLQQSWDNFTLGAGCRAQAPQHGHLCR
jgi:Enoyl-(Acyl carrier protein) reductase